ncbi:Arc family DNA-binding protein [Aeromonas veronii]
MNVNDTYLFCVDSHCRYDQGYLHHSDQKEMYAMREYPSFCLRMPPEVKSAIKESAKNTGRTMNSEIVQRLKEMLKNEGKLA